MTELVLGTAQLGEGYGITNTAGRLDDEAAAALLHEAVTAGVRVFDTAEAYGDAETRLGHLMPAGRAARYVTKLRLEPAGAPAVSEMIARSAARLRTDRLHGVLLHRLEDLSDHRFPDLLHQLRTARDDGRVDRIGVSVYDADDLGRSVDAFPDLDIIQIPGSAADTRLLDHPFLAELAGNGVECHVRSVFLQGLLLQEAEELPERFGALVPLLHALDAEAERLGVDRLGVLLSAVRRDEVAGVVVGATSAAEFAAIAAAWSATVPTAWDPVAIDVDVLDPRRW
jgi:aryl-alcohol dehydrogenase-like predicted oxidoreductase